jgi:hypothetical protein
MYQIELTKRIKTFRNDGPYETTHRSNQCIFQSEDYKHTRDVFVAQLESEIQHHSLIDYSCLSTMVELYSYDVITKERRLLKTISIQNF